LTFDSNRNFFVFYTLFNDLWIGIYIRGTDPSSLLGTQKVLDLRNLLLQAYKGSEVTSTVTLKKSGEIGAILQNFLYAPLTTPQLPISKGTKPWLNFQMAPMALKSPTTPLPDRTNEQSSQYFGNSFTIEAAMKYDGCGPVTGEVIPAMCDPLVENEKNEDEISIMTAERKKVEKKKNRMTRLFNK
jgi:hypothetical protein